MEVLAIIKDVNIGMRDCNEPVLWFTTHTSECSAALQVFNWVEAGKLIKDAKVYSVNNLEGKACFVEKDGWLLKFIRVASI